jgi:hypothetical protein
MPYKGDTWFRIRGEPTYRRFFIRCAFEEPRDHILLWDSTIRENLDSPGKWTVSTNLNLTELSPYSIHYETTRRFNSEAIKIKIGLYRDGFHITMNGYGDLRKHLFNDVNQYGLWTQEAAKVAPMTNELLKKIEAYYFKLINPLK